MESINTPSAVYTAWWTGLIITILLLPVAVCLLQRTLNAARSIRRYLAEMEAAGARIADNTEAIAALNDTGIGASGLLSSANSIESHCRTLGQTFAERAAQSGGHR